MLIKHRAGAGVVGTKYVYPRHPFDVAGWDGCLYPYTFNIGDFEPITGRVHQPPPVHQVFAGDGSVICTFVPRKVDYHPYSIPVPYYHSNVDSDEVMFYYGGDYEARKGSGIGQGSVSLHPGGHAHGPQPGAYEASIWVDFFDEFAVMVDTFRPLELGEGAHAADDPDYPCRGYGVEPYRRGVTRDRDIGDFDRRAAHYDEGWAGRMHRRIVERTVEVALTAVPAPERVLDVGCGTGTALGLLAGRLPTAVLLLGVDPAVSMVETARSRPHDERVRIERGAAEALPVERDSFDLVVSVTSFDHWADQSLGLRECAAALRPNGALVLTDLFSPVLAPTMVIGRRGSARTVRAGSALLRNAGFAGVTWHSMPLLKTAVAVNR